MKEEPNEIQCADLMVGSIFEFYVNLSAERAHLEDPNVTSSAATLEVLMRDKQRALVAVSLPTSEMSELTSQNFDVEICWGEERSKISIEVKTTSLESAKREELIARGRHPSARSTRVPTRHRRRLLAEWAAGTVIVPSVAAACAELLIATPATTQAWALVTAMLGLYPAASTGLFINRPTRFCDLVLRPYVAIGRWVLGLLGLVDQSAWRIASSSVSGVVGESRLRGFQFRKPRRDHVASTAVTEFGNIHPNNPRVGAKPRNLTP